MRVKKGQVWIETVLYTLIGLVLIGMVLAFITPKINQAKDKVTVEQTINSLNVLDEQINSVLQAPGNIRNIDFTMKRGELYIDGPNDRIIFVFNDLEEPYTEPDVLVKIGRIGVFSTVGQKLSSVNLTLEYPFADITYDSKNEVRKFSAASIPYRLSIANLGTSVSIQEIGA